jgi:V8-like Glu-specific endopeptidase
MSKRYLMLAIVVLCCASAAYATTDPGTDATQDTSSSDAELGVVSAEAAVWFSDDPADDAVKALSTPGLARQLYTIPKTALVIPARVTEKLRVDALARTDARDKNRLVGVHVPLASMAPSWERIDGPAGRSWRLAIVSEDASFMRPHFPALPRGDEATVVVYGVDQVAEEVAPPDDGIPDVWGPSVEGSVLFVEVVTASREEPSLVVDMVASGIPQARKSEDECYSDVSCFGFWSATKTGIGRMLFSTSAGAFVCTGALAIDKSRTFKPYFLTARHCISTASVARTLEVSWKFGTNSCNGSVPNERNVPKTRGSKVQSTGSSSDFTLLLLDKKPPSGSTYLGWTTESLANGTDVTCIHHPAGAYKRISFADITGTGKSTNFWRVVYVQSSTEGGSSGSPLMLDSTRQIVGTLSSGSASCANPAGFDDFGKFSKSFSSGVSKFLNK